MKTVPFILVPICFVQLRKVPLKLRWIGGLLVLFPTLLALGILAALAPQDVLWKVIFYRSTAGWFGLTGLLGQFQFLDLGPFAVKVYMQVFALLLLGFLGFCAHRLRKRDSLSATNLLWLIALFFSFVIVFGPGYGSQYVGWYLPAFCLLYAAEKADVRRLLQSFFLVGVVTYTIEYALFESHGSFLLWHFSTGPLEAMSATWSTRFGATLLRLPLFFFFLQIFRRAYRVV